MDKVEKAGRDAWAAALRSWLRHSGEVAGRSLRPSGAGFEPVAFEEGSVGWRGPGRVIRGGRFGGACLVQ